MALLRAKLAIISNFSRPVTRSASAMVFARKIRACPSGSPPPDRVLRPHNNGRSRPICSLWMYTMNRCSRLTAPLRAQGIALLVTLLALAAPLAHAQHTDLPRSPPIAAHAQRGVLRVVQPPEALLNGQPARLAPGARIRDRNNLLVVSGALLNQDVLVRYTVDTLGFVHEVWVLTDAEAAQPVPATPN